MSVSRIGSLAAAVVLAVFLVTLSKGISLADGKGTFASKGCGGCHQTEGPATEKTFEDKLKQKGVELWYAGSKFKKAWLVEWLEKPVIIRLMAYNSVSEKNTIQHPALSKAEAQEVGDYLMTLTAKEVVPGSVEEKGGAKAKNLFIKQYGCIACHILPDKAGKKKTGGVTGPDLSEADKRLNGDWVYAYLKDIKLFKPVRRMPNFAGIIPDEDMKALAGFVTGPR